MARNRSVVAFGLTASSCCCCSAVVPSGYLRCTAAPQLISKQHIGPQPQQQTSHEAAAVTNGHQARTHITHSFITSWQCPSGGCKQQQLAYARGAAGRPAACCMLLPHHAWCAAVGSCISCVPTAHWLGSTPLCSHCHDQKQESTQEATAEFCTWSVFPAAGRR
jgi:hypothetical protein